MMLKFSCDEEFPDFPEISGIYRETGHTILEKKIYKMHAEKNILLYCLADEWRICPEDGPGDWRDSPGLCLF